MADAEQVEILLRGVRNWNQWREAKPEVNIDLSEADFSRADLSEADRGNVNLSGANLSKADLGYANLSYANLSKADLRWSDLSGAKLSYANLSKADLSEVDLTFAALSYANLRDANLSGAKLSYANLSKADLSRADLKGTDLSHAQFIEANLTAVNLQSARLQDANLEGATATEIKFWETQRAGWSIKGIVCKRAFWDRDGVEATHYASGEFERLHADQLRIELFYPGGIKKFELNTLPLLLHRLTEEHPAGVVRLSRLEETGGGTKVVISVEEGDSAKLQKAALEIQRLQIEASANKQIANRLEDLLRSWSAEFFNFVPKLMEATAVKQNTFNGPVGSYVEGGSEHTVTTHQSITEAKAIQDIAAEAKRKSDDLHLSPEDLQKLQTALANLNQAHPHQPAGIIQESLMSVRHILEHAAGAMLGHEAAPWLPAFVDKIEVVLRSLGK